MTFGEHLCQYLRGKYLSSKRREQAFGELLPLVLCGPFKRALVPCLLTPLEAYSLGARLEIEWQQIQVTLLLINITVLFTFFSLSSHSLNIILHFPYFLHKVARNPDAKVADKFEIGESGKMTIFSRLI